MGDQQQVMGQCSSSDDNVGKADPLTNDLNRIRSSKMDDPAQPRTDIVLQLQSGHQLSETVADNDPVEVLQLRLAPMLLQLDPEDDRPMAAIVDKELASQLPLTFAEHLLQSHQLWTETGVCEGAVVMVAEDKLQEAYNTEYAAIPKWVAPQAPHVRTSWNGRHFDWRNVKLNGKDNAVVVSPGSQVQIEFEYQVEWNYDGSAYCPGCVVQLYFGLGQPSSGGFSVGLENGLRTMRTGKQHKSTFTAPAVPGVYYITSSISLDYNFQADVKHSNDLENALAVVVVE